MITKEEYQELEDFIVSPPPSPREYDELEKFILGDAYYEQFWFGKTIIMPTPSVPAPDVVFLPSIWSPSEQGGMTITSTHNEAPYWNIIKKENE